MSEYTQFYVGLFTTMQQSAKRWEPSIMKEITRTHTDERPFCDDPQCPCHHTVEDEQQNAHYWRLIVEPMNAGLLTAEEANRIFFGEQL